MATDNLLDRLNRNLAPGRRPGLSTQFKPKLLTVLAEGYDMPRFRADALAGLTVAIVALPLAMALAVASGASPDRGLVTAVIAGFLISLLGGSRVQIGGPTGAFVVVVFNVIAIHGYDGLLLATAMAGIMLVAAGYAGIGRWIRFIPHPVVTGFTAGIALIIATSQVKDFLGLTLTTDSAAFIDRWRAYAAAAHTIQPATLAIGAGALALIAALRRFAPRFPAYLIVIVAASAATALLSLPVDTIGSRFPGMSASLPMPELPAFSLAKAEAVLPSALTIAFLAGIEALLSCVVADGMTGFRHRSNQELVGQGVANIASALFAGLPATGAIARTATNIKAGGRTPVAGIFHAFFLLLFMLLGGGLMAYVPMAALAAILFAVAWGMSESERFIALLRMSTGERTILLTTFLLTVLVDLTVAIGVGVTAASLLFMTRMSETVAVTAEDSGEDAAQRDLLPEGVEVFRVDGPLFFGVAGELVDALKRVGQMPHAIILRLEAVPYLDATGAVAVAELVRQAAASDTRLILCGAREQPNTLLDKAGLFANGEVQQAPDYEAALALAGQLTNES